MLPRKGRIAGRREKTAGGRIWPDNDFIRPIRSIRPNEAKGPVHLAAPSVVPAQETHGHPIGDDGDGIEGGNG